MKYYVLRGWVCSPIKVPHFLLLEPLGTLKCSLCLPSVRHILFAQEDSSLRGTLKNMGKRIMSIFSEIITVEYHNALETTQSKFRMITGKQCSEEYNTEPINSIPIFLWTLYAESSINPRFKIQEKCLIQFGLKLTAKKIRKEIQDAS